MRFVVFDLEFTQPNQKILQIGAATLNVQRGKIKPLFNEICDPGEKPNSYITDLTGISKAMVEEARPLQEVLISFWKVFKNANAAGRLASWGQIDIDLITAASYDLGITVPKYEPYNFKNMVRIFRSARGQSVRKGVGLKTVSENLGIPFEGTQHNALHDAVQTAKVMQAYYDQLRENLPE